MEAHPNQVRLETVQRLALQLRRLERRPVARGSDDSVCTGLVGLDRLLGFHRTVRGSEGGGARRGQLLEWLTAGRGTGGGALISRLAAEAMGNDGTLIMVDLARAFYPLAASKLGIALERTIVVRPNTRSDLLWALEQSLACPGVAVVIGAIDQLDDLAFRRLQLATESSGVLGQLIRPIRFREQPSWAHIRLLVESLPARPPLDTHRRLRVQRLIGGERAIGREDQVELEVDDETSLVRVASAVAPPASLRRAAGA